MNEFLVTTVALVTLVAVPMAALLYGPRAAANALALSFLSIIAIQLTLA